MLLSVIIPALNEERCLRILLPQLLSQQGIGLDILVSDGGSIDQSRAVCLAHSVQFLEAPKGRARQMNYAANRATGRLLLFLHADSELQDPFLLSRAVDYFETTQASSPEKQSIAGHFPLKFRRRDPEKHGFAYRFMEEKTAINRPDTINGDQGLLISQDFFRCLGRFDESLAHLEDQGISLQIFKHGRWIVLPGELLTAARRFEENGLYRVSILMATIMIMYHIDQKLFFDLAPDLYREQSDRNTMQVAPFLGLIWKMQLKLVPVREVFIGYYRVGRYVLSSSWLLFYFFDHLLRPLYGRKIFPLLKFRDRYFHPLTNNAVCASILAILCHVAFFWILYPILLFVERFVLKLNKQNR